MNNRGDFFIGNKRVSSATGQERTFDAPIATVTGEDPSRLSVIFDEVIIKERLVVEGGKSNTILTQFDGPVTFNKLVKLNDDLTVNGIMKLNNTFEITSTIDSSSKDTGAFTVEGGVGVEKNLNVGGNLGVASDIVGDSDLTIKGNATIGDANTDSHTFNGTVTFNDLVNLNGGIDVDNIDIGGSDPNLITTDTGDLKLSANGTSIVQVNDSLSVQDTLSAGELVVDETNLNNNTLQTTSGNENLTFQAHGTGVVVVNDSFKFGSGATVDVIRDEDDMASNDANALATQQSIKAYVDDQNSNQQTTVAADSGTNITLQLGTTTLGIIGTSNEIVTDTTTNNVRIGLTDDVTIPSDLTVTDNLVVNGNTTLGNDVTADTVTVNGRFSCDLAPSTDDDHSLGTSLRQWKNLFIDGTAHIDSLNADTADIDGGNIDGTQIGAATPSSGVFNLITVDNTNFNNNSIVTHSGTNASITINPDGTGQTIIQSNLDLNGDLDVSGNCQLGNGSGDTVTIPSILDVNGRADIDNIRIDGDSISSTAGNGSIFLLPNGNGDVVVGDGTDNDLHCKGDVVAFHTSDITLKENITRIPDALDKVSSLSGNTFTWIKGHKYEGYNDTGVIAQEVEALGLPGLTTTRDDGTKAVRYERLIPVLIEAIKELKTEIEELKK